MPRAVKPAPKRASDKVKAHQRYYLKAGAQVPGVTTVLGVLNKPALVGWANRLGLDGIDVNKYRDEKAAIGNVAHYLIECDLAAKEPQLDDYTPAQVEAARSSLASYYEWTTQHELEPVHVEGRFVSERYRYGGTVDFYGLIDGRRENVDFKTSARVYGEHKIQLAAYCQLTTENGFPVSRARIIRIGRGGEEGFDEYVLSQGELYHYWEVFKACLTIYYLQRKK